MGKKKSCEVSWGGVPSSSKLSGLVVVTGQISRVLIDGIRGTHQQVPSRCLKGLREAVVLLVHTSAHRQTNTQLSYNVLAAVGLLWSAGTKEDSDAVENALMYFAKSFSIPQTKVKGQR